jgi:protein MpaA
MGIRASPESDPVTRDDERADNASFAARTAGLVVLTLVLSGCVSAPRRPDPPEAPVVNAVAEDAAPAATSSSVVGRSLEGHPIEYRRWGRERPRVMFIATIHGDEPAGTPLLKRLERALDERPELRAGRSVLIVPLANPDGLAQGRRGNARGVDLNRNFPAGNWKERRVNGTAPLSEPESLALNELIQRYRPDRIISIHQPLACIDYDGAARDLAQAMSGAGNLPVRKLGARSGSLGSYAGLTLGIPAPTLWRRYGPLLLTAIRHPDGVVDDTFTMRAK